MDIIDLYNNLSGLTLLTKDAFTGHIVVGIIVVVVVLLILVRK